MLKRGPGAGYGMRGFIVKSISPSSPPFLEGKEIECRRGMLSYKRTNPQRMREESKRERERERGTEGRLVVPRSFDIPNKSFVRFSTSFVYLEELSELLSSYAQIARYLSLFLSRKKAVLASANLCIRCPLVLSPFRSFSPGVY